VYLIVVDWGWSGATTGAVPLEQQPKTKGNTVRTKLTVLLPLILAAGGWVCPASGEKGAELLLSKPVATLDAAQALTEALAGPDGEYAARAEYAAILAKFGAVPPYAAIIQADERHIAALKGHFEMRGLPVPADPFGGKIEAPATLQEAAKAGVRAEERNVAMYDKLLAATRAQRDLQNVFTHLRWASREHHLPAFKAAMAGGGKPAAGFTCGQGKGPGRGGPPPWAGGPGRVGKGGCGGCCGACWATTDNSQTQASPGRAPRWGWGQRGQGRGPGGPNR
jgi:hypothetical protein